MTDRDPHNLYLRQISRRRALRLWAALGAVLISVAIAASALSDRMVQEADSAPLNQPQRS